MGSKRRTVSDIKTALRAKIRSKPRVRGSEFLEMFILEKNKARLEQEKENIDKKRDQVTNDIQFIDDELEDLQGTVEGSRKPESKTVDRGNNKKANGLKTMTMEY